MKLNKEFFKRYSSWVNAAASLTAVCMLYIPDVGLDAVTTGRIMLAFGITNTVAQLVSQGVKDAE